MRKLKPVTPGELLLEEFLNPMGISQYRLAEEIGVPAQRVGEIVAGRRAITADTALRLARWFGTSAELWMNLQQTYELDLARQRSGEAIGRLPTRAAVAGAASAE